MAKYRSRPALDVVIPDAAAAFVDIVEAIADDFRPFAIEVCAEDRAKAPGTGRRIHFSRDSDRHAAARAITDALGHAGVVTHPVDVADDGADWAERCQKGLSAVRVGNIIVAPPWAATSLPSDASVVVIRPSMGFGTGHHASTRLCLRALQIQPVHSATVTDLGTGSGVLAIAAARLGARSVVALEYDPDATASARENLQANAVDQTVSLRQVDLTTATPPPPADIVCANLTGAVLCRLATQISACVVASGALILGGLTTDEEVAVIDAFAASSRLEESLREGEWSCLILRARARESCTQ